MVQPHLPHPSSPPSNRQTLLPRSRRPTPQHSHLQGHPLPNHHQYLHPRHPPHLHPLPPLQFSLVTAPLRFLQLVPRPCVPPYLPHSLLLRRVLLRLLRALQYHLRRLLQLPFDHLLPLGSPSALSRRYLSLRRPWLRHLIRPPLHHLVPAQVIIRPAALLLCFQRHGIHSSYRPRIPLSVRIFPPGTSLAEGVEVSIGRTWRPERP